MVIVSNIYAVDKAVLSIAEDRTACAILKMIALKHGMEHDLAFVIGVDQNNDTILETSNGEERVIALTDVFRDIIKLICRLLK